MTLAVPISFFRVFSPKSLNIRYLYPGNGEGGSPLERYVQKWGKKHAHKEGELEVNGRMVRPEGVEPPTYWFVASCSIQLSYGRTLRGDATS